MEEVGPSTDHDAYLLDTSAYSAFKRGHKQVVGVCRYAEKIVLPCVVLGELYAGFRLGGRESLNRRELAIFMRSPRVSTVEVDEATAERYAAIRTFLREAGTPVSANDMWIAACAMQWGLTLATADHHFSSVSELSMEQW